MKPRSNILGKIIGDHWNYIEGEFNSYQIRILGAIRDCRTPALGGHLYQCNNCGSKHKRYNSCRNRHCPQCQNTQKEKWVMAQQSKRINTTYFHVVFTIPHGLNQIAKVYTKGMYDMMMKMAWETLNDFGWNHKYLGAQLGTTMVLHSWGSNLSFHPHVHCIVPGGGITLYQKWKEVKGSGKFLFPVKALSQVYRAKLIDAIKILMDEDGNKAYEKLLMELKRKDWVVYAKPSFGGRETVIQYLARYSHKIAITHHRIIHYDGSKVRFKYTDYRHSNVTKVMTLDAQEFIRRFAQHILPKRFMKIRHYGILSSAWKVKLFPQSKSMKAINWEEVWMSKGWDVNQCPYCKKGSLELLKVIRPVRGPPKSSEYANGIKG